MSAKYRIKSVQTSNFVVSSGKEMAGDRVKTVPAAQMKEAKTVVSLSPPISANGNATVMGKAGLYVAVGREDAGEYLVWSRQPFMWTFATNGPPGTHS